MAGLLDTGAKMQATPRTNRLAGLLADALGAVDGFARKPFGYDNPPAGLLSDALAVPQMQRTLDRLSYGEPLTTGKGQATAIRPDTADAALAVAPAVAKWPKQAGGLLAAVAGGGVGPDDAMRSMNITFAKGGWKDRALVRSDGVVEIPLPTSASNPLSQYRDKAFDLAREAYAPKYEGFFRFTNNPLEVDIAKSSSLRNSINHADNTVESGVSVAMRPHYGIQGYKHGYRLDGDVVGYGSDGEPLLDPKTIRVLSDLMASSDIVAADRRMQAEILRKAGLPDDYFSTFNFTNSPQDVWK